MAYDGVKEVIFITGTCSCCDRGRRPVLYPEERSTREKDTIWLLSLSLSDQQGHDMINQGRPNLVNEKRTTRPTSTLQKESLTIRDDEFGITKERSAIAICFYIWKDAIPQ